MRGDITELKRALADRALAVAQMLLPAGKMISGEWEVGSVDGEPGKSLKVALRGPKAGVWSDFAAGEGGDLIDLWIKVRRMSLVEALDDIRGYLGVERPTFQVGGEKRTYTKPQKPICTKPVDRVRDYLVEDRNLSLETLEAYRVGAKGNVIVFPFLRDGELVMCKVREAIDGAKPKPTEAGCEKILFGWQAVPDNARQVIVTEGEIDALSMHQYGLGIPAVSVPFGGGGGNKQDWIENEFDRLQRFEVIYLALDNDEPGQQAVAEISRRLGQHRCRVVKLPRKDANECLVDGVSREEILAAIRQATTLDPEGLRQPIEYTKAVTDLFWPEEGKIQGYTLPFGDVGHKLIFRPSEVTLWSGASGSGKSQLLSNATVSFIEQGSRLCVASLEMAPAQSLKRMVKQAANTDRPTKPMIAQTIEWLNHGLLMFDLVGKVKLEKLLEIFEYARARYGCDQFVIDSLMRLGLETDDYNGQEQIMFRVVDWAIANQVHVHFVAHSRKADSRHNGPPEAEDVKGAMEIGANAFNIIMVWRNKNRELVESAGRPTDIDKIAEYESVLEQAGVIANVCKQRNGDWEGRVRLWFNQATYQYRGPNDSKHGVDYVTGLTIEERAA